MIVGLFGGGAPWALPLIPIKAITIQAAMSAISGKPGNCSICVRAKKIAPIPVTTMPLAKANEALVDLQKGKLVGRAVSDALDFVSRHCERSEAIQESR